MTHDRSGPASPLSRFDFVDFARGLAILLALVSHAVLELRLAEGLGTFGIYLRCATRAATPAFVLIFGVMLELVYVRKMENGAFRETARRLLGRSFLCYLAYLATIATELLGGKATPREALDGILLLSGPAYGYILKFYMFALLLAVPVLALRLRFGILAPLLLFSGFWLLVPLLDYFPWEVTARLGEINGLLLGRPRSPLSLLHGSVLIGIGMAIGWSLRQCQHQGRMVPLAGMMGLLWGVVAAGIGLLLLSYSPWELLQGQGAAQDSFRMRQGIEYYVLALASSLVLLCAAAWLFTPGKKSGPGSAPFFLLGRHSLLAFTLGNALLNLMPLAWGSVSPQWRFALSAAYLLAMPAAVWLATQWKSVLPALFPTRSRLRASVGA